MNSNEKVGLVLSGGGARSAYEVGVMKAIYEDKCPATAGHNLPEVFCGSGAGAFNAAVIASRFPGQRPLPVEYLESLWADEIPREGRMRNNRVYRKRGDTMQFFDLPFLWRRPLKAWGQYLGDLKLLLPELASRTWQAAVKRNFSSWLNVAIWHDTEPMRRLISESISLGVIRAGEPESGENSRPHRLLRVVATERGSGQPRVFGNADFTEDVGHALVLASCSLPVIFPSVKIHGKEYMYGGLVMQTPLRPAIDAGCTVIHLIHTEPRVEQRREEEAANTMEMLNRTVAVALSATLERDLDVRRRINEMLRVFDRVRERTGTDVSSFLDENTRYRHVVVHQYRPRQILGGKTGYLDFSRGQIETAIAAGEQDGAKHDCAESGCIL